ncbi:hypothetical protein C7S18_02020 [Ahniella affigens]|uniref:Uncharacterized protein n=1 Tax=Ahniella affigens TaxID=2021234 RepID=A0A2P1PMI2_9GAMM|nr:hypothetical protein C7S18_02020 [Ahniella affigens]
MGFTVGGERAGLRFYQAESERSLEPKARTGVPAMRQSVYWRASRRGREPGKALDIGWFWL